ncbi:hypothetical protein ACA910_004438 [Epithemia clementina (nom. ined.)]
MSSFETNDFLNEDNGNDENNDKDDRNVVDTKDFYSFLQQRRSRAIIAGVSVERHSGFWAMLQLPSRLDQNKDDCSSYWAVPVTNTPLDRVAATSGPALTLVQLLSHVDMAGMVFPPSQLAQLLIVGLEEEAEAQGQTTSAASPVTPLQVPKLRQYVQQQIQSILASFRRTPNEMDDEDEDYSYTEASTWIRSRVRLPLCTLDQVHLHLDDASLSASLSSNSTAHTCLLDVVVTDNEQTYDDNDCRWTYRLNVTESTVAQVLLEEYQPMVSRNFLALALALRYMAPIVVVGERTETQYDEMNDNGRNSNMDDNKATWNEKPQRRGGSLYKAMDSLDDEDKEDDTVSRQCRYYHNESDMKREFPMYVTVSNLQQSSNRVVQNIERSFEMHQLQAAWKVARQKQDYAAMAKIRTKLDELDQAIMVEEQLPVQPESQTDQME